MSCIRDIHPIASFRNKQRSSGQIPSFFIFPCVVVEPASYLKRLSWSAFYASISHSNSDIKHGGYVGTLQDRKAVIISTGSSDPSTYPVAWQTASHTNYIGDILAVSGIPVVKQMNLGSIHQYRSGSEPRSAFTMMYMTSHAIYKG